LQPGEWQAAFSGDVENFALDMPPFPGPVTFVQGAFNLEPHKLSFTNVRAAIQDSTLTLSGSLQGFPHDISGVDLIGSGSIGPESVQWTFTTLALPQEFLVRAPVTPADVHVVWQRAQGLSLVGSAIVGQCPAVFLDMRRDPETLAIHKATIKDQQSNASLSLKYREKRTDFSFSGTLAQSSLNAIFTHQTFGNGKIAGQLRAAILADRPMDSTAQGAIEGDDIVIPWGREIPLRINAVRLHADGRLLTVAPSTVTLGKTHYDLSGAVSASDGGFVLDADMNADRIDAAELQQALAEPKEVGKETPAQEAGQYGVVVRGTLRAKAQDLILGKYDISRPVAEIAFGPDRVHMKFTRAQACHISLPGTLDISRGTIAFGFQATAVGQRLEQVMSCLAGENVNMSGAFDLNADLRSQGKSGALLSALEGNVSFTSKNGKIYHYPLLAKIFSVLSVTEIFRGKTPELGGSGFPYNSIIIKGNVHQGTLKLEQAYIDGSSLDLIAEGEVDLAGKKVDLVVLVAPFSTINWVISHIPLVGKIMGGTLISVPVKVSGDLANPDVFFLAPSAVGTRLLDILKNIVNLPVEIISPLLPKGKEEQK